MQHSMDATEHIFLGYAKALKRFLADRRQLWKWRQCS